MESFNSVDDAALIAQIAQQDHTALSKLYDRYARLVYAVALKSLGGVEEAEEVVLDVFSQVWTIAVRYDPAKGRGDAWILMLARSRVLDRLRKLQRAQRLPTSPIEKMLDSSIPIQSLAVSVDPLEDAIFSERRGYVLEVLKNLPDEQRLVIELAYYQGLSQSEIATTTGMPLGTVKTRIRLGLNKLRSVLASWREV